MSGRNIASKFIAALVAVYLVLGNCAVAGLGIAQVIAEEVTTPGLAVDFEIKKYVQYNNEGVKAAEIQTSVNIEETSEQQRHLPVNIMKLEIQVPSIDGIKPDRVNVLKSNTGLTNGIENYSVNQNYNKDTGLLTISYNNENNYSEYKEGAKDELEIVYFYSERAYLDQGVQKEIAQKVNIEAEYKAFNKTLYTKSWKQKSATMSPIELKDGDIIKDAIDLTSKNTTEVYKGYMYCNESNKTTYTTDYKTVSELNITNKDVLNEIQMHLSKSKFIINDKEVDTNSIQYKYTKISEEEFNKVIGQDGALDFYIGTTKYASIKYADRDGSKKFVTEYFTQTKQNIEAGKVEYPSDTFDVVIKISKPINEGKITIEELKQVVGQSNYGTKVSNIKAIKEIRKLTYINTNESSGNEEKDIKENNINIGLINPSTQISLELSNNKLSTLTTNKLTATIKINDTNSSCNLVNGGNIELALPANTVNAKVISVKSLYENGISIKKANIENGKVILEISGKQTNYDITNISGGVNIVLDLEIDIEDTVATHNETITAKYNETVVNKEIEISSVNNVLVVSKTKGYDDQNTETSNIGSKTKAIQIPENVGAKEIKHTVSIVNNYDENIQDVQIIGRIGYSDSTFEIKLSKAIVVNKNNAKVYYSNNKNALYNDSDWVEQFSDKAKSYKIVLKNSIIAKSDSIEIEFYAQIPANLGFNQSTLLRTDLDYKFNNENKYTFSMTKLFTVEEELIENNNETKNENENMELSVIPYITQNYVHEGQRIVYKVRVGNRTNHRLENILLEDVIPENAVYTKKEEKEGQGANYLEIIKDENKKTVNWTTTLEANSYKEFEIMLTVKNSSTSTQEQQLINTINATYSGQTLSVENKLLVKPARIIVDLSTAEEKYMDITYSIGDIVEYRVDVKNTFTEKINNIKIEYNIPKYLEYVEGGLGMVDKSCMYTINDQGNLKNNTFEYSINKLNSGETKTIIIRCKVERLQTIFEANINSIINVKVGEDNYQSNVKTIKTIQPGYTVSMQSNKKATEILQKGEKITYIITVNNIGKKSGGFRILDKVPAQLEVTNLSYRKGNGEVISISTSKNDIEFEESLNEGETLIINVTGFVKEVTRNEDTINISNFVTLKDGEYEQKSNEVTNIIKCINTSTVNPDNPDVSENPDNPSDPEDTSKPNNSENPNNPNTPDSPNNPGSPEQPENNPANSEKKTFDISGLAWLDTNKDGKRDDSEKLLSGIKVYLINSETGKIVTDLEGKEISVSTAENGEYKFEKIAEGSYLVIFEFDINRYKATKYQASIAGSSSNSDAIISKIKIDEKEKTVGATNVLTLKSDLNNIDIGLIEDAKFDLSLEKQISKVSVINAQGTKTTEYENINFAKADLVAKYMNNTSVIVTYKFIIRNIGDVTGYVDVLKDNLPKGLQFSSELNKDWYKGKDGALYTEALSGIAIEPGKTSEIELVLTKDTTENSTGTFTNSAELERVSNIEAVEQAKKDNDKSSADIVISIKTGSPILYIGITLGCITVIAAGAYVIKKKILNRVI